MGVLEITLLVTPETPEEYISAVMKAFSNFRYKLIGRKEFTLNDIERVRMHKWPQYNAGDILLKIIQHYNPKLPRINFLLTTQDITVRPFNFVFGLAQEGCCAVLSSFRMRPSFYQMNISDDIVPKLLYKDTLHEIGHVLGLAHCHNKCVMNFSNTLSDLIEKHDMYCKRCKREISQWLED